MIMGAYALLLKNPKATRADIVKELDSHLCRCGAHVRILEGGGVRGGDDERGRAMTRTSTATRNCRGRADVVPVTAATSSS